VRACSLTPNQSEIATSLGDLYSRLGSKKSYASLDVGSAALGWLRSIQITPGHGENVSYLHNFSLGSPELDSAEKMSDQKEQRPFDMPGVRLDNTNFIKFVLT
jgi:hypothetical protein